jgi:predicted O-linked N-acetylglucosamine transferase (SPINDLY family)
MQNELLASALSRATERNLSVIELIQTVEAVRPTSGEGGVKLLYETWIEHNQDNPLLYAVLFNYSVTLTDTGALDTAHETLERAISLKPDFMPAHINLGRIHERQGKIGLAVTQWSQVIDGLPQINGSSISHKITALNQAARVLEACNQDDAAENMLRLSVEVDPAQREPVQHLVALRQRQCEWPVVSPWERVNRATLMKGMSPLSYAAYTDDPMLQLAGAWHYNKDDVGTPDPAHIPSHWAASGRAGGPLRIGYLSSDLREHAVGHLMSEVLSLHDRSKVEVFSYYCGIKTDDAMHRQFKADSDQWVDVTMMNDVAAAQRMADDGIQILVDLNGYTREGRTKLVALRPAPVIVNWLGYPGTMGSPYHHYIVADDWIIPPENEIYYSEKVLRLPCYQPTNRHRIVSARAPSRADAHLPENETVFCSFNGVHKLNRFTFERWMTILKRAPGSVLWLLSSVEAAQERLRQNAKAYGVDPARLIFAEKRANPDHLARYPLADLFLDSLPYGAHTTASDALWMGVPVLTLSGRSFASRVCGSLVRSAGVPELVCNSPEEFVDHAVALGRDKELLQQYRNRLTTDRDSCTLFDTPKLVSSLEALYAEMWRDFEQEKLPQPDLTNLGDYLEIGIAHNHETEEVLAIKDYQDWWREKLKQRNKVRPLEPDRRLFTP